MASSSSAMKECAAAGDSMRYNIKQRIGGGSFGEVYIGVKRDDPNSKVIFFTHSATYPSFRQRK